MSDPVLTARFTMDEAYFREDLAQWTAAVSRKRKFAPWVALTLLAGAGTIAALPGELSFQAALLFVALGLMIALQYLRSGSQWLSDRRKSDKFGRAYEFTIGKLGVQQVEPPTENQLALRELVPTKRGIILRVESGHLYIPASSITPVTSREELLQRITAALMAPRASAHSELGE